MLLDWMQEITAKEESRYLRGFGPGTKRTALPVVGGGKIRN